MKLKDLNDFNKIIEKHLHIGIVPSQDNPIESILYYYQVNEDSDIEVLHTINPQLSTILFYNKIPINLPIDIFLKDYKNEY